jgi:cell division protein FtsI/penicillin-binding protein 2
MVALMGRVSYLQTYGREQTIRKADRQQHQSETLLSRRGCIYDSTGMLMAGTIQQKAMFIDPKFMAQCFQEDGRTISDMDQAINQIASILDKDSFEMAQMLGEKAESRFVKIAENIDDGTAEQIEKLDLPGVGFTPMNVRYYPMGSIAAHVLGGTGKEGTGLEGVELKFEKMLAGKDGFKRTLKDARRRPLAVAADDYLPPLHGQHLILTLDANIQMIAEQELAHTCDSYKAKRGEAIVMDPKTGDVLAMANWPNFNPQSMEESTPEIRRNRCLTDPYEPGSTAKPFVAGPALAWKFTRLNEVWPIHGPVWHTSYGRKVTDVHGYDQLATWDVLVKSSNIGMSMLGNRMGNQNLYKALTSFGFGKATGIDLPGEDPGLIHPLKQWTKYSTESVSQGYEMMVTPMQLARGFCAYANGGRLVQPRILKGVLDAEGNVVSRNETKGPSAASRSDRSDHRRRDEAGAVRHRHPRHGDQGALQELEHLRQDRHRPHRQGRQLQRHRVHKQLYGRRPGGEPAAGRRLHRPRARPQSRGQPGPQLLRRRRRRPGRGACARALAGVPAGARLARARPAAAADRERALQLQRQAVREDHSIRRGVINREGACLSHHNSQHYAGPLSASSSCGVAIVVCLRSRKKTRNTMSTATAPQAGNIQIDRQSCATVPIEESSV